MKSRVNANAFPTHLTTQFSSDVRNATQFNGIIFYSSLKNFVKTVSLKLIFNFIDIFLN